MKFDFKASMTSTGKASIEYRIIDAETIEEFKKLEEELKKYAMTRYGNLNGELR